MLSLQHLTDAFEEPHPELTRSASLTPIAVIVTAAADVVCSFSAYFSSCSFCYFAIAVKVN